MSSAAGLQPSSGSRPLEAVSISASPAGEFTVQAGRAIRLSAVARIEALNSAGVWIPLPDLDQGSGYRLLDACSATVGACRTLAAGERLVPVPWSGATCSAQCAHECPSDVFHPGRHRLVVSECDDPTKRFEGPAFEMVDSARTLARFRAASKLRRATVFRLDPVNAVEPSVSQPPDYVAAHRVLAPVVSVSAALLGELSQWLQSPSAFVPYNLLKRCTRRQLVGLLLYETVSPTPTATELSIDLACNSLLVVTSDDRGRHWTESQFDPSRADVLSIVRRALPLDHELETLR